MCATFKGGGKSEGRHPRMFLAGIKRNYFYWVPASVGMTIFISTFMSS
jgi:hypothetical protein